MKTKPKKFEDKLDISSTHETTGKTEVELIELDYIEPITSSNAVDDLNADYEFLRNKLMYALTRATEILDHTAKLVKQNPDPFSINAAGTILKSFTEFPKELLNLHKTKNKIEQDIKPSGIIGENLSVVGGVSDILKKESN